FGLLCGWLVPAYLLPFAALWGYLGVTADYGSPDVLAALAGPVGISLAVALGRVLGTALPYPVLAPGIGLLVFLLFQLPNMVTPGTAALVPTLGHPLQLGLYENPIFVGYRLLTMLVLVVVFLGLAGMLARRARWADFRRWRVGLLTLLAFVLVILPGWLTHACPTARATSSM